MESLFDIEASVWSRRDQGRYFDTVNLRQAVASSRQEKLALRQQLANLGKDKTMLLVKLNTLEKEASTLPKWRKKAKALSPLISSSGSNFHFLDRQDAFDMLARSTELRFRHLRAGRTDKKLHPIPFLADGPGSGKSRWLFELPVSFKEHVLAKKDEYPFLSDALQAPMFISISFGSVTGFFDEEIRIGIDRSLSVRILDLYLENATEHLMARTPKNTSDIQYAITLLSKQFKPSCLFLCLDEVNRVYQADHQLLQSLFNEIGKLGCSNDPLVVSVLAGTVIRPMTEILRESTHPPLRIPLPLLSRESSLLIIREKLVVAPATFEDVRTDLEEIVADIGGHPRALEFLYDTLCAFKPVAAFKDEMDTLFGVVQGKIQQQYDLRSLEIDTIIAKAFLSQEVFPNSIVKGSGGLTYQYFEERGIIKLRYLQSYSSATSGLSSSEFDKSEKPMRHILIPYLFVSTWFTFHGV
jgi:hypothetical protein